MHINAIHVGLPKCASNLLQRSILIRHPEIECVTPKFSNSLKSYVNSFLAFGPDWDGSRFSSKVKESFGSDERIKILSQEGFSGSMITGQNSTLIARTLKELFGSVFIIIVIREQFDYIFSVYRHLIKRGEVFSYKRFLKRYGEEKQLNYTEMPGAHILNRLTYHNLIKKYFDFFGSENVLVLLYEDLADEPQRFASQIYSFLNVQKIAPEIKKYNKGILCPGYLSLINFFCSTPYNNGKTRLLPVKFSYLISNFQGKVLQSRSINKNKTQQLLPESYLSAIKESNSLLSGMIGMDLSTKGYLV